MTAKPDFYDVLGVARDAGADEIKKAYRKQAAANHPDRNPGDEEAIVRFKAAAEAFEILGDEQKRAAYDRYGHAGVSGRNGGAGFQDVNDIFGAFGDLFEGVFGGQGGGGRGGGRRPQRGDSLRCDLKIDLKEAAFGCVRTIEVERAELCSTCDGSGAKPGTSPEQCSYCNGRGQIVQSQGFFRIQTTCPACRGGGEIVRERCSKCHGNGREAKHIKLDVKVPPGVDNGMQLCLRGEGDPGPDGGPRGDLYCDVRVAEHPLFKRHGHQLTCKVPLTFSQAVLGTEIEIPLLQGRHNLVIPAGSQPNETVRLRGKGMPDPQTNRKGDLIVELQVEVPRKLTKRQEELVRELATIEQANVSPQHKSFFEKLKNYFTTADEMSPAEDQ